MSIAITDPRIASAPLERAGDESARRVEIAIAGVGLISPLGISLDQTWAAMMRGESIERHAIVPGEFKNGRAVGLGVGAGRVAISEAGWTEREIEDAALIVGTSKGPVIEWLDDPHATSLMGGVGDIGGGIARELGLKFGPRLVVSTACASGLQAVIRGALMIRSGEAQRVLVIGAEASVHELFIGSSQRLGVGAPPGMRCRPFDENRKGFLTSEAGAAICLEKVETICGDDEDADAQILLENCAIGGDGLHLTGLDPQGQTLSRLMSDVLDGRAIDLVHAHGTGTIQNDEVELAVIERCIAAAGGRRPILYSHKGALGHTLGAAGVVSVVLNCICHRRGMVPPSLASAPMSVSHVRLSAVGEMARIRRSIAMAAGFGGAVGVVSLISN